MPFRIAIAFCGVAFAITFFVMSWHIIAPIWEQGKKPAAVFFGAVLMTVWQTIKGAE